MNKKRKILLIAIVAVLIAAGTTVTLILVLRERPKEPVTISMQLPWGADNGLEHFRAEADLFEELYEWITVELESVALGDLNRSWTTGWPSGSPDVAVLSDEMASDAFLEETNPFPWTGPLWALYVNTNVMGSIDGWSDGPPEDWNEGVVTFDDMESTFAEVLASGVTPISVGAQYGWPLAAWLQHISISANAESRSLAQSNGSLTSEGGYALDVWTRWVANGWITDSWQKDDWPIAARDLANGSAAFTLMGGTLVSSFPRGSEGYIVALPFPRGEGSSWTVGSLWSLAIPAGAPYPEEAKLFFDFLTSEGVTGRLSRNLKAIFYDSETSASVSRVYTSVTNQTDSPLMKTLMELNSR